MRKALSIGLVGIAVIGLVVVTGDRIAAKGEDWSLNATIIEACSCPMFCMCFFNSEPAAHHGSHGAKHFCKFNMGFKVNSGRYGEVKLDGVKFWIAGDLGDSWEDGKVDWARVTFDKGMTEAQREGLGQILPHLYPVEWASFSTGEGTVEWTADKNEAWAKLDGGKSGEIRLKRFAGMTEEPIVIDNLKYWGAQENDGFVLMPNVVQAWRGDDRGFEYKGTTGFMITFELDSDSVAM